MNPAMKRDELRKLNPGKYTVPGKNENRTEISKISRLLLQGKKNLSSSSNQGREERQQRRGRPTAMPECYTKVMEAISIFEGAGQTLRARLGDDIERILKNKRRKLAVLASALKETFGI